MEKLLPQNIEAEEAVLGSILIDPTAIMEVATFLRHDDFYREAHQVIYRAALDLYATHEPADLITLTDELGRLGTLDQIGGASYVTALANQVPTSANVEYYARIVARTALLRRLIHAAGQIAAIAYHDAEAEDALGQAQHLLLQVAQRHHGAAFANFGVAMDRLMTDVRARIEHVTGLGIRSGFARLDDYVGGFDAQDLIYLCGQSAMGKSYLASTIVGHVVRQCEEEDHGSVGWVTLEMSEVEIARRVVCAHAGINTQIVRGGFRHPDATGEMVVDREIFARWEGSWRQQRDVLARRLHARDVSTTQTQLRAAVSELVVRHQCRFVVVDYLSLVDLDPGTRVGREEVGRLTELSATMKGIARDCNVVVLCIVQLNRSGAGSRPQPEHLYGASRLFYDANVVLGMHYQAKLDRARAYRDPRFARFGEVSVMKARGAEDGLVVPVEMQLHKSRILDWPEAERWPEDPTRDAVDPGHSPSAPSPLPSSPLSPPPMGARGVDQWWTKE